MSEPERPGRTAAVVAGEARDRALSLPRRSSPPRPAEQSRFEAWRQGLDAARSGMDLLDALISAPDAPNLVPMLPVEDLHRAIHRVGLADCTELLALASSAQIQGILDVEIWEKDQLSLERLDPWMEALMHAGPEILGQRILDQDDALINWLMKASIQTIVVEEPEDFDPPDVEHVLTPDGRLCICFPDPGERDLPTKIFLDWLMRHYPVYCVDLLVASTAALDSALQEDAYRWRTGRLADRGYVEYYEALAIYSPPPPGAVSATAATDDATPARTWLTTLVDPEARLAAAIGGLDATARLRVHQQLGYVANMALSADRVEPWDIDAQEETLRRVRAGLVLGLDALGSATPSSAADGALLASMGVAQVFRAGYAQTLDAAAALRRGAVRSALRRGDDPVGAVDHLRWHRWAEVLTARHPAAPTGRPLDRHSLPEARRWAEDLASLATAGARPDGVGIGAWAATGLARAAVELEGPGRLPPGRLVEAHQVLFVDGGWRPAARAAAARWWAGFGDGNRGALDRLLDAMAEQLAAVDPLTLEPRFAPWLLLETD